MKLQFRFVLLILTLFTVLLGGVWLHDRMDTEVTGKLRSDLQRDREALVHRLVELTSEPLRIFTADYSPWDDLVNYVSRPDPAWSRDNIDTSFDTYRVDAVWILRPDFSEVYGISRDQQSDLRPLPFSAEILKKIITNNNEPHCFIQTNAGLLEFRGAPIRPSDRKAVIAGPYGWLFAARRWDDTYLRQLEILLDGRVEISAHGAPATPGATEIITSAPLHDWQGQPIGALRTIHDSPALLRAQKNAPTDLLILCAFGLIALISYTAATHFWVIRPLRSLGTSLQQHSPTPLAGLVRAGGEFGALGRIVATSFQQEAKLRQVYTAFNAIDDAVFISDLTTGAILHANLGATRLLGHETIALEKLTLSALKIFPHGESNGEVWLRCADGRFVEVDIREQILGGPTTRQLGVMVARDISDRRKIEQQRLRAQRLESLGTLAGGVAHDMNNMLTPIMLMLEELDDPNRSISPTLLASVRSSVKRGATILRQLLSFGHGFEGERAPLALERLVEEIGRIAESTFPKSITFESRLTRKLPCVIGDPTQIHQVLLNLCVNARDAMPDGGSIHVSVSPQAVDATNLENWPDTQPGEYALIEVRDTGAGIPPEIIDRIFDPFFTTKSPDKGTGLGLSTTLGIVRGHGGTIKVQSQPGRGTCFSMLLPASSPLPRPQTLPPLAPETKPTHYQGAGHTVLIIEDEAAIRDLLRRMFGRMAYAVIMAEHGQEGLDLFRQHTAEISLVLTDLNMPGVDGLSVLRTLRAEAPTLPLLVMSGRLDEPALTALQSIGISSLIDKPFSVAQILDAVQKAVEPVAV